MPTLIFLQPDGTRREIAAPLGDTVLEIAHRHGVALEGACGGSLACATCHVIVADPWHDLLPAPTAEENDMLDLAPGVQKTSRLGCQLVMTEELDGLTLHLPPQL